MLDPEFIVKMCLFSSSEDGLDLGGASLKTSLALSVWPISIYKVPTPKFALIAVRIYPQCGVILPLGGVEFLAGAMFLRQRDMLVGFRSSFVFTLKSGSKVYLFMNSSYDILITMPVGDLRCRDSSLYDLVVQLLRQT
jgi:hypothetical protein